MVIDPRVMTTAPVNVALLVAWSMTKLSAVIFTGVPAASAGRAKSAAQKASSTTGQSFIG